MTHQELQDALGRLSAAHGPQALAAAYRSVQQAVRRGRKAVTSKLGPFVASMMEAMRLWDEQKAEGGSLEERRAGMERTLRASWPLTREWKYICDACDDYGLRMQDCPGDATCGRKKEHLPHTFGTPCWCAKGIGFRGKPKAVPEDFASAGRSKPTRIGR